LIAQSTGRGLPRETLRAAQTPSGVDGSTYGMGWQAGETAGGAARLRHTGWLLTHNSVQTTLPDSRHRIARVTNTGIVPGAADGLTDLIEGRPSAGAAPFTMTADLWLGALTLLSAALGVLGVLRARAWARRRRPFIRLIPYALPVALFLGLADLIGLVMNRAG